MSTVRRFRVAPALVRLVRKERGSARVLEGFFPPQANRTSFVRVEGAQCHLVLVTTDASGATTAEERTEVPRAHGDALLDVCAGKAVYERSQVALGGGREVFVDRYSAPGALDLVTVAFDDAGEAGAFAPPAWFGPEVTGEGAYEGRNLALQGVPAAGEAPLSNAALEALLDVVEHRFAFGRYGAPGTRPAASQSAPQAASPAPSPSSPTLAPAAPAASPAPVAPAEPTAPAATEADVMNALRRLAVSVGPTPAPESEAPDDAPHVASHEVPHETPHEVAGDAAGGARVEAASEEARGPAADGAADAHADAHPDARAEPHPDGRSDARIDDVIESLSQALGAVTPPPAQEGSQEGSAPSPFERWTVRPRRQQG